MLESSLGGSGLEPGTVPGHGWEERGSSQVICSSKSEVIGLKLRMLVI